MESSEVCETEHPGGEGPHHQEAHQEHVLVRVITTSGAFPRTGENRVKETTLISFVLDDAASDLRLTDTGCWVVREGGRQINPERSFAEEGLHGMVKLQWGPHEGGGG